jgi:hypothetical protein
LRLWPKLVFSLRDVPPLRIFDYRPSPLDRKLLMYEDRPLLA